MSMVFYKMSQLFLDSSAVEHPAVNRRVVGSNPTRGAKSPSKVTLSIVPIGYKSCRGTQVSGHSMQRIPGTLLGDL